MKQVEIILLSILLIFLPSSETLKIIFWALYILFFLARQYQKLSLSFGQLNAVTYSAITIFVVSLISTALNWPITKGLSGSFNTLSYIALFLCLYHGGYSSKQIKAVMQFVIIGTVLTLLFGLYEYSYGFSKALQLHSVGATTHSSIYLGIVIITAIGLLLDNRIKPTASTILIVLSLYFMGTALLYMGSRGALLATVICAGVLLLNCYGKKLLILFSTLSITVALTAFLLVNAFPTNMNKPDKLERFSTERLARSDNERLVNWKIAISKLSTGKDLVWGIGPLNYQSINPEKFGIESSIYKREGKLSHAHNLFLTQLVEQGIIGISAMLVFFFLILLHLKSTWSYCKSTERQWIWAAGFGAIAIPIISGLFNTPFYREHAMLAMILIGAMFSETKEAHHS